MVLVWKGTESLQKTIDSAQESQKEYRYEMLKTLVKLTSARSK